MTKENDSRLANLAKISEWIDSLRETARDAACHRLGLSDCASQSDILGGLKAAPDWVVNEFEGDMQEFN